VASPQIPTIWRLRHGLEKKFSKGHPWVFSNDLDQSPKGHPSGSFVELRDSRDQFLAFGYGNPTTLIAFRLLSRMPISSVGEFLKAVFAKAANSRNLTGVDRFSHRLIFGEADGLPGIIVDRYLTTRPLVSQVFVVQSSTAGGDQLLPELRQTLLEFPERERAFSGRGGELPTVIVLAQDSSSRAMEGLSKLQRECLLPASVSSEEFDGRRATIAVQVGESVARDSYVEYDVDFIEGQKTGFFLDQRLNVRLSWPMVSRLAKRCAEEGRTLKVLDLFCYVGQWSVQIAEAAKSAGAKAEITIADASASALEMAARNVERVGAAQVVVKKSDILAEISQYPVGTYDVVICDPPAFIKKKKDHPTGRAAYLKLNREAIKRVKSGGLFVSCSCSGLLLEAEFDEMLSDAKRLSGREVLWVARGGHGEDHPSRSEFPQGRYLKGALGIVT
jgi:23S rRNA (cytosine1962-C5)-methyltransferase